MSSLPPPPPTYGYAAPPPPDAQSKVSPPAIAIAILAGLSILGSLLGLLRGVLGIGAGSLDSLGDQRVLALFSGGLGVVLSILGLLLYGVALFGALKMKNLESYGLSVASAIISMLPCSCCCVFGLPIGIWALVVLMDQNVKAAFRS